MRWGPVRLGVTSNVRWRLSIAAEVTRGGGSWDCLSRSGYFLDQVFAAAARSSSAWARECQTQS